MLRFEAEPTREPYGDEARLAFLRKQYADSAAAIAAAPRFVLLGYPCGCDFCANFGGASQWTREEVEGFEGAARDRIMAGVDMPGRIVDDVRPDQRGEP